MKFRQKENFKVLSNAPFMCEPTSNKFWDIYHEHVPKFCTEKKGKLTCQITSVALGVY